jgi:hypothetical protein
MVLKWGRLSSLSVFDPQPSIILLIEDDRLESLSHFRQIPAPVI